MSTFLSASCSQTALGGGGGERCYKNGGEGGVKFNPYKRGWGKSFSHAEGEGTKHFVVVLMRDPYVFSHTEGGGHKMFPLL